MSLVRFEILPPVRNPEEKILICGSPSALGGWDPGNAFPLRWEPPFHVGEILVEDTFEFKILRTTWETEAVDAFGHTLSNFSHKPDLDALFKHTVADWKDRFRGQLIRQTVHSRILDGEREILVWLPSEMADTERFPLILLQDGANVFDPATSFTGVDWAADEWVPVLHERGLMPRSIVAAVCHPGGIQESDITRRDAELSLELGGANYARFLVEEAIPCLDKCFPTLREPYTRTLGGASLGALLAFYSAIHHPNSFGQFICLSTSFEDISQQLPAQAAQLLDLEQQAALPTNTKIYFDFGDKGLDECYEPYHADLGNILRSKGWNQGREFAIQKIPGGSHEEISWRFRFGEALTWLAS